MLFVNTPLTVKAWIPELVMFFGEVGGCSNSARIKLVYGYRTQRYERIPPRNFFGALALAAFVPTKAEAHPHFHIRIGDPIYYDPYAYYGDGPYGYYHHHGPSCGHDHHWRHRHDDDDDE